MKKSVVCEKRTKRAQVSIFVIIGIVVVVFAVIFIGLLNRSSLIEPPTSSFALFNERQLQSCLQNATDTALVILGQNGGFWESGVTHLVRNPNSQPAPDYPNLHPNTGPINDFTFFINNPAAYFGQRNFSRLCDENGANKLSDELTSRSCDFQTYGNPADHFVIQYELEQFISQNFCGIIPQNVEVFLSESAVRVEVQLNESYVRGNTQIAVNTIMYQVPVRLKRLHTWVHYVLREEVRDPLFVTQRDARNLQFYFGSYNADEDMFVVWNRLNSDITEFRFIDNGSSIQGLPYEYVIRVQTRYPFFIDLPPITTFSPGTSILLRVGDLSGFGEYDLEIGSSLNIDDIVINYPTITFDVTDIPATLELNLVSSLDPTSIFDTTTVNILTTGEIELQVPQTPPDP